MSGPSTTNRVLAIPTFGSNVATWGTDASYSLNANSTIIDQLFGAIQSISVASGNVTLSTAQSQNGIIRLTGAIPSSAPTITFPTVSAFYIIDNTTTTASATDRYVILSTGTGNVIATPRGSRMVIGTDASTGNVYFASDGSWGTGDFKDSGGTATSLPAWVSACTVRPWLICDGSAVSRTTYAQLFSVIATAWGTGDGSTTFNLPDLRFRVRVPLDNMGGSAAGRSTGATFSSGNATTVGSVGGEAAHTLTEAELAEHNHSITDPGHTHFEKYFSATGSNAGPAPFSGSTIATSTDVSTASSTTGITISDSGSDSAHNTMQPFGVTGLTLIKT